MSNNDNTNISTYINNNNYANKYIPKKTKLTRQTNTYYINDYYDEVYELNDFLFDFDFSNDDKNDNKNDDKNDNKNDDKNNNKYLEKKKS